MEEFIEQTLLSVLDQNYSNLEFIVIDGQSTDQSVEIIRKYESRLAKFISEPDKGQYDAIQKGMNMATGDILAWLNADDVYLPWTLSTIARLFTEHPEVEWACGLPAFLDESGGLTNVYNTISARPGDAIRAGYFRDGMFGYLQQESMFWRKTIWDKVGGLNLNYGLAADFELWIRFAETCEPVSVGVPLAGFRERNQSRSRSQEDKYRNEVKAICDKLPRRFSVWSAIAPINQTINKLVRLLVWRRVFIYYFSIQQKKWVFARRKRPIASVSFTRLQLERNIR